MAHKLANALTRAFASRTLNQREPDVSMVMRRDRQFAEGGPVAIHETRPPSNDHEPPFYRQGQRILTLTYRSKAASPPGAEDLGGLLKNARARNRAASVTGMLLHSDENFFQWLEGPEEGLKPVWESIQNDPRHTHLEVLNREFSQHRLFSDWDMRLVSPTAMFETVCQQTRTKRSLPPKLVELTAKLALEGRLQTLRVGLEDTMTMGIDLPSIYSGLIESAAHLLGDWWRQDLCSEREIALALCSLRSVVREVAEDGLPTNALRHDALRVLLIPPPDESHMLGLSLANDLYHHAGFSVSVEFPKSQREVAQLVSRDWFDVLTLSMSDVFTRHERIDELSSIISSAREQSRNPNIIIVVGGRAVLETPALAGRVGADAAYTTLADIVQATHEGVDAAAASRH